MRPSSRSKRTICSGVLAGILATAVAVSATTGVGIAGASAPARAASGRVDLTPPVFSDPTNITNPLFPKNSVDQVVQLGAEGDVALRHEITQLDRTKTIEWNGQRIEAAVSQFVAYGDGEIIEVAVDYLAQADDGSVWYLGEDVDNYENGVIANHNGSWLAGRDGPGGMIMPAHPRVGDTYNPENIPGLVFEAVTVLQTDLTVAGPRGPVSGAILVRERPMDGNVEDKVFAPGYGEFTADVPASVEHVDVAVAVPIDARDGRTPRSLTRIGVGSRFLLGGGPTQNWQRALRITDGLHRDWTTLQSESFPPHLTAAMNDALDALDIAVAAHDVGATRQAAIDVGLAVADLTMLSTNLTQVDGDRTLLWRSQLTLDRSNGDNARVASDRAVIRAIRQRMTG